MKKNIIVILGPQGSGKGTQAKILAKRLNLPHISAGDLIREAGEEGGKLGKKIDKIIDQGKLIPAELTLKLIKRRIKKKDCRKGFILDGYPRSIKQVRLINNFINVDKVIEIDISKQESIKRLTNRRQCPRCGAIYNLYTAPKPKKDELCDKCKIKLKQRDDDKKEAIEERLAIYHKETKPVLKYYKDKVVKINGEQSIKKVAKDIEKAI